MVEVGRWSPIIWPLGWPSSVEGFRISQWHLKGVWVDSKG